MKYPLDNYFDHLCEIYYQPNTLQTWIENKAEELSDKFPLKIKDFVSPEVRQQFSHLLCNNYIAQEAYDEMIEKICIHEAERLATEHEVVQSI